MQHLFIVYCNILFYLYSVLSIVALYIIYLFNVRVATAKIFIEICDNV